MGITSLVIRQKEFKTRFRGFDVQEVDVFLEEVAAHLDITDRAVEKLTEEKRRLDLENQGYRKREDAMKKRHDPVPERSGPDEGKCQKISPGHHRQCAGGSGEDFEPGPQAAFPASQRYHGAETAADPAGNAGQRGHRIPCQITGNEQKGKQGSR